MAARRERARRPEEHPGPADDDRVTRPAERGELLRCVGVREQRLGEVERGRVDAPERDLASSDPLLEDGQERARVGAGQRDPLARHGTRLAERPERAGRHERVVDRERDDDVVPRAAQPRDEPVHRRAVGGSVVDDGERQAAAGRPPCRRPRTSSHASARRRRPRSASVSPRNRARAFGEPNRREAPPTSSTPVSRVTR